jgi:hypothetical protein
MICTKDMKKVTLVQCVLKASMARINDSIGVKVAKWNDLSYTFSNWNCLFHQISYRKDMQGTHTYTAELDRPDIKKATQISKIISDVISLS